MSEQFPEQEGDSADGPKPSDSGQFTQQVRPQQVTARVPESVARGVFSTGALIQQGNNEFVLDFLVTVTRPHQIVARVIMPPGVVNSMMQAMRQNIEKYTERWGPPPELPKPPQPVQPPPIDEIYSNLKIPDDVLSGSYANALMISHSPSEFVFDFITGFYPKSSVSCRVFMSAAQGPRLLDSLGRSWQQYQRKIAARRLELGLPPIDEETGINPPGVHPGQSSIPHVSDPSSPPSPSSPQTGPSGLGGLGGLGSSPRSHDAPDNDVDDVDDIDDVDADGLGDFDDHDDHDDRDDSDGPDSRPGR